MSGSFTDKTTHPYRPSDCGVVTYRIWTLVMGAGLILTWLCQASYGQLRSGRVERSLHPAMTRHTEQRSPESGDNHARKSGSHVVPTAYQTPIQETGRSTRSIMSPSGNASRLVQEDDGEKSSDNGRQPEPIAPPDRSFSEPSGSPYDYAPTMGLPGGASYGMDYGSGGCDSLGCDSCGPGRSMIAPTCSMRPPAGMGPLRALWCRTSVRAEIPLFWRRAAGPPPLVTSSPVGTSAGDAGVPGRSTTDTLLGGSQLNEDPQAGFRITLAAWLDARQEYGVMFRYWNAGDQDDSYAFNSNQTSILARPFFNTTVPDEFENDAFLVAFPNTSTGSIQVDSESSVDGLELSLKRLLYRNRFTRVNWLYGYQYVGIDEGLRISSSTTQDGQGIDVTDAFFTENRFHGFAYGLASTREFARWKLDSMFRLGLGNLNRRVDIRGSTTTRAGGQSNTEGQGLLARNTNMQVFEDDTFVVVPEVGVNLAYRIRSGLDFNVGYNFMLIPKVAQASQQINDNLAVNLSDPLSGSADPSFQFDEREFWLHSLGLGLQLRY